MGIRFAELVKIQPLMTKYTTTVDDSAFVNVSNLHWVSLLVSWGAVDTAITITVEEATSNDSSVDAPAAIGFSYRMLGAVGSDSAIGDLTTCGSTGYVLTASTDDNKAMLIEIDPATLTADHKYVRVEFGTATASTIPVFVGAFGEARYKGNDPVSSS